VAPDRHLHVPSSLPAVFAVSDGTGSSAEHLVRSMLVQFGDAPVPVIRIPGVRVLRDVENTVALAAEKGGLVVHTLLDAGLRTELVRRCEAAGVATVDLLGELLGTLTERLGAPSTLRPGLYRRLHQEYFQRVEAIEYAVRHDDGQHPDTLDRADLVLLGVSRTGKTPLCMFLAMQGWMAANVPLVAGVTPPGQLEDVDHRRLVGLTISSDLLVQHRAHRHSALGTMPGMYTDPARVFQEIETARAYYRRRRIPLVDVTNKPIEASAREVIMHVTRRLGLQNLPGLGF